MSASAANFFWTNTTAISADFFGADVWNQPGSPGGADNTVFTNDLAYTVTFSGSALTSSNVFNSGTVTLDIGSGQYWSGTNNAAGVGGGAAFQIGRSANATVYLASGTLTATNNPGSAYLNLGYLAQGSLWVTNGAVIVNRTLLGSGNTGQGILVLAGNTSTYSNTSTFIIGNVAGSTGNSVVVSNSAAMVINSTLTLGNTSSGGNSLLVDSSGTLRTLAATTIGSGSSNNIATVQGGAEWNLGNQNLTIGTGAATGNRLVINGGLVTNIATLTAIGNFGGNSLTVSNGGKLFMATMNIGAGTNTYNIGGLGDASFVRVGNASAGFNISGQSDNTINVTNATLFLNITGNNYLGISGGRSHTLNVLADGILVIGGGNLSIGNNFGGVGFSNALIVSGGVVTNNSSFAISGGTTANGNYDNSLTIINGGRWYGTGGLTVGGGTGAGGAGSSNNVFNLGGLGTAVLYSNTGAIIVGGNGPRNSMTVTNADVWSGVLTVGSTATNNTLTVLAGSTWNLLNNAVIVGASSATGNRMTIQGGTLVNVGSLNFAASGNHLLLTNGATLFTRGGSTNYLGNSGGAAGNTFTIVGGTTPSIYNAGGAGSFFLIGYRASAAHVQNNQLIIGSGGVMTNVGVLSLSSFLNQSGNNAFAGIDNQLIVTDGGKLFTIGDIRTGFMIGTGGSGYIGNVLNNSMVISEGGEARIGGGVWIGYTMSGYDGWKLQNNSLIVTNGGRLFTGADSYIGGHNNTTYSSATNNNNSATIGGSLSGTKALWDVGNNNLYVGYVAGNHQSTGNVLNVGVDGLVTNVNNLVAGWGAARSNSVVLSGGSIFANNLVVSNLGNRVTFNSGLLNIANSTVYSNGTAFVVGNGTDSATMLLNGGNHRFQAGLEVASGGTLGGGGTVIGAVTVKDGGTLAPGNSAGIFTVGALTLEANSIFAVELGGTAAGSFDQLIVNGDATLTDSILSVSLINAFVPNLGDTFLVLTNSGSTFGTFAGLAEGAQFVAGGQTFQISYLGGDGNDVLLTVIPEPSSILLVGAGLGLFLILRRRRQSS